MDYSEIIKEIELQMRIQKKLDLSSKFELQISLLIDKKIIKLKDKLKGNHELL